MHIRLPGEPTPPSQFSLVVGLLGVLLLVVGLVLLGVGIWAERAGEAASGALLACGGLLSALGVGVLLARKRVRSL
jgi:hypothetical protein